jgi:hypothetical protein
VQVGKFAAEAYTLVGSHKEDDVQMFASQACAKQPRA